MNLLDCLLLEALKERLARFDKMKKQKNKKQPDAAEWDYCICFFIKFHFCVNFKRHDNYYTTKYKT